MTQKMYKYNKPAEEGKKAPTIICYANNEAHAMQVLRERLKKEKEDGTYEYETIDKSLIEEYIPKKTDKKKKKVEKKKSTTSKK